MSSFEDLLRERGGMRLSKTTRILPPRQKSVGPRTGSQLGPAARSAGDCFYFAASPIAKFVYSKIEERYAVLPTEEKYHKRKQALMNEAKSILNEHRNQIVEAVLPMFDVWERSSADVLQEGDELPEADRHAHDYFVGNVFTMLCRTYHAWLPEFVSAEQLESSETTLARLTSAQRERLESELRNFKFGFRYIVAPK